MHHYKEQAIHRQVEIDLLQNLSTLQVDCPFSLHDHSTGQYMELMLRSSQTHEAGFSRLQPLGTCPLLDSFSDLIDLTISSRDFWFYCWQVPANAGLTVEVEGADIAS